MVENLCCGHNFLRLVASDERVQPFFHLCRRTDDRACEGRGQDRSPALVENGADVIHWRRQLARSTRTKIDDGLLLRREESSRLGVRLSRVDSDAEHYVRL